jgi:hypothetical protein
VTDETAENVRAVQAKGEHDEKVIKELLKRKLIQSR